MRNLLAGFFVASSIATLALFGVVHATEPNAFCRGYTGNPSGAKKFDTTASAAEVELYLKRKVVCPSACFDVKIGLAVQLSLLNPALIITTTAADRCTEPKPDAAKVTSVLSPLPEPNQARNCVQGKGLPSITIEAPQIPEYLPQGRLVGPKSRCDPSIPQVAATFAEGKLSDGFDGVDRLQEPSPAPAPNPNPAPLQNQMTLNCVLTGCFDGTNDEQKKQAADVLVAAGVSRSDASDAIFKIASGDAEGAAKVLASYPALNKNLDEPAILQPGTAEPGDKSVPTVPDPYTQTTGFTTPKEKAPGVDKKTVSPSPFASITSSAPSRAPVAGSPFANVNPFSNAPPGGFLSYPPVNEYSAPLFALRSQILQPTTPTASPGYFPQNAGFAPAPVAPNINQQPQFQPLNVFQPSSPMEQSSISQQLLESLRGNQQVAPPAADPAQEAVAALLVQPKTVTRGNPVSLSWSSVGMKESSPCVVRAGSAIVAQKNQGSKILPISLGAARGPLTFTLSCTAESDKTIEKTASVIVN